MRRAYDAAQRLTLIEHVDAAGGWLARYTYSYAGANGDTGLRQRVVDDGAQTTTVYSDDGVNRLTGATTTLTANPTTRKADYQ